MLTLEKIAIALSLFAFAAAPMLLAPARADMTIIEERKTIVEPAPRTVHRSIAVLPAAIVRSNYEKRLADLLDQINLGRAKGWLTAQQGDDLSRWQADLLKEEQAFLAAGGGIIPRENGDQLERQINSLAVTISRQISAGSGAILYR